MIHFQNFTKSEVLALMAANAPNPPQDYINTQSRLDRNRNPHNDPPPKPPLREEAEIIADYKIGCALVLMNRLECLKLEKDE